MCKPKPETLFDRAVQRARSLGTQTVRGFHPIAVLEEPRRHNHTGVPRRIDLVPDRLRGQIRRLLTGEDPWPLFLWGDVGTGKTAAGLCMCDHIVNSWYTPARFLVSRAFAQQDELDKKTISEKRFVVLDELGTRETYHDLAREVVQDFADRREAHNRVAVYISNVDVKGIMELYDPRIASRLSCGTIYHLEGPDRRRESRKT